MHISIVVLPPTEAETHPFVLVISGDPAPFADKGVADGVKEATGARGVLLIETDDTITISQVGY